MNTYLSYSSLQVYLNKLVQLNEKDWSVAAVIRNVYLNGVCLWLYLLYPSPGLFRSTHFESLSRHVHIILDCSICGAATCSLCEYKLLVVVLFFRINRNYWAGWQARWENKEHHSVFKLTYTCSSYAYRECEFLCVRSISGCCMCFPSFCFILS